MVQYVLDSDYCRYMTVYRGMLYVYTYSVYVVYIHTVSMLIYGVVYMYTAYIYHMSSM